MSYSLHFYSAVTGAVQVERWGLSLLVSLWLLQPGVTTMVIVAPLLAMVTLWSPRPGLPIEKLLPEREPLQPGHARRQADAVST